MSTISVHYSLGPEARKVFAKATGSLDLQDAPALPSFPGVDYVPHKGDALRWDAISKDVIFVVENRLFRFSEDGGLDIDLFIECYP